jgi:peptidoglycan/xylan/chitin deacetylase (PgdA/CDA1 family)
MITHPLDETPGAADEQPTQPIEPQRASLEAVVEQQPTQPIELQRELRDELPILVLPINKEFVQQRAWRPAVPRRSRWKMRLLVLIPLYALLIGGGLLGRAAVVNWLATKSATPQSTPVILHVRRTTTHSSAIDSAARGFMQAMMSKDWEAMWPMLSPDAQRLFQGEQDFARFERAKFGAITLISYQAGVAQLQQPWLDPDTTFIYPIAATLQVSLEATAPKGVLTDPSMTELDNGLFHNTLLSLVPRDGVWQIMVAGPADLDAPVLVPAAPPQVRVLVPVFMYHHVSNKPVSNLLDYSLTVTTTAFNAQLDWLQAQGYHSVDMTELFDALYYGKALPPHPMVLTFDDGYEDMYTDAVPALLAHHYRGVFFIITGMIGGRYMTWNQVRLLDDYGMQIASHTVHHINIGRPPAYTTTQKELLDSKNTLQSQLGQPIQFFCYPTGEPFHHDSYYERQLVLADLLADGYVGATLDPFSFNGTIQSAQTPYQLPRVRVNGGEALQAFAGILNAVLRYDASQLT